MAVVVPTVNEEATLPGCLDSLPRGLAEIVVSDGGSTDGTVEIACRRGARVVSGAAGRGAQLNRGARACSAPGILFLHADTRLPPDAARQVARALADGAIGGGFRVRFDDPRWRYRLGAGWVNVRTRLFRAPLGDQAQFVRRAAFEELGGFRDWPLLEDLDLIRRLHRRGRLEILRGPAITSARRYVRQGALRTVATNWLIWMLYLLGVPPARLSRLYQTVR